MSSPTLLLATHNANKRRELAPIFERALPTDWPMLDLSQWPVPVPEVIEDRDSFEGNAIKKALETSLFTGTNVISEDSGRTRSMARQASTAPALAGLGRRPSATTRC